MTFTEAQIDSLLLRTDRCLCRACGEVFSSESTFDKHRVGPPTARHCNVHRKRKNGDPLLHRDKRGVWISYDRRSPYRGPDGH